MNDKKEKIKVIKSKFVKITESKDLLKINDDHLNKISHDEILTKKKKNKRILKKKNNKVKIIEPRLEINLYNPDITQGLNDNDVLIRKQGSLSNKVPSKSSKNLVFIILKNIFSFFNILMIGLVVALTIAGAKFSNYLFLLAVFANLLIYIIQEIKAKFMIDKLSLKTKTNVIVIRNGTEISVSPDDVVVNDIILLKPGMEIPADLIIRGQEVIEVNESMLTGESDAIIKGKDNVVYAGSYVVSGQSIAQAVVVGNETYIEKLSNFARKYNKPKSEIINSINFLIKILGAIVVIFGILLFVLSTKGLNERAAINQAIIHTVGALVGMIPAGLVVLTSMALAVGVVRLSLSKTLVQELSCIEMLARVDTLCLDKTGTITDGSMNVSQVIDLRQNGSMKTLSIENAISAILTAMSVGNATDRALYDRFNKQYECNIVEKIPFDSKKKYQAIEVLKDGVYILGAPEFILKDKYRLVADKAEKEYRAGSRVLLLAHSNGKIKNKDITGSIDPLALIILDDSIRSDAKETIEYFKNAGVDVKVISGDNPVSVSRISQKVGIVDAHKYISLEGMDEKQVKNIVNEYTVFGRVTPNQKRWLIQALKKSGKTVAMTGDGVNDILALKEADTSIAMASGSEAARNVSNMVLLDSNFSSMPKVVKEGRRVINNIKKVATIFLTKTIFSILLSFLTIILLIIGIPGSKYPISPAQLLLIDWFIVGIPSFFLALESNDIIVKKSNFLKDIILSSLPGAIGMIISISILYGFKFYLPITNDRVISTLILYSAISVFLAVFIRTCKPFNIPRAALTIIMIIAIVGSVILIPQFFDLAPIWNFGYSNGNPLTKNEKLLLLVIVQLGYPVSYITSNIGLWFKKIHLAIKQKQNKDGTK